MSSTEIPTKSKRIWKPFNNISHKLTYSTTNILFWNNKNKNKNGGSSSENNLKYFDSYSQENMEYKNNNKCFGKKPEHSGRYERSPLVVHGIDTTDSSTDYLIESYKLSMKKQKEYISEDMNDTSQRTQSLDKIYNNCFLKGEAFSSEDLHPFYLTKNKSSNDVNKIYNSLLTTKSIDKSYSDVLNSEEISQDILFWLKTKDTKAYKMEKHERLQAMLSGKFYHIIKKKLLI
uniref:PRESAN domain-containing protein n=1 Tax=Strongyloides stercoralis TaxID=6248 RepID=A0A0K0ELS8_STRER